MRHSFRDFAMKGAKFAGVGLTGTVVNLSVLFTLVHFFYVWYIAAEIVAICTAFATNYAGNILVGNIHISEADSK